MHANYSVMAKVTTLFYVANKTNISPPAPTVSPYITLVLVELEKVIKVPVKTSSFTSIRNTYMWTILPLCVVLPYRASGHIHSKVGGKLYNHLLFGLPD